MAPGLKVYVGVGGHPFSPGTKGKRNADPRWTSGGIQVQRVKGGVQRRSVRTWHGLYSIVLVVWCSLILGTHPGYATMLKMSVEDLARQADTIVVGTVTRQESAWDTQHTAIYTDVTVAVERMLAGTP